MTRDEMLDKMLNAVMTANEDWDMKQVLNLVLTTQLDLGMLPPAKELTRAEIEEGKSARVWEPEDE